MAASAIAPPVSTSAACMRRDAVRCAIHRVFVDMRTFLSGFGWLTGPDRGEAVRRKAADRFTVDLIRVRPGAGYLAARRPGQGGMEARLGADFSDVRVHTGSAARSSAAEVDARRFVVPRPTHP